MVIDKIKFSIYLKSFFVLSYILYAIFVYLMDSTKVINDKNMLQKDFLLGDVCLSILGGSNAKWGISSGQLNTQNCSVKNYGVDFEGGSFEHYTKWFSKDIKSQSVIYSPYLSLSDNIDHQGKLNIFPATSIMSEIKRIFINDSSDSNAKYDLFGDFINYDCRVPVVSFKFKIKEFARSNKLIAIELNSRIKLIGEITGAKEIYVRIPPVYVDKQVLEDYEKLMNQRIVVFREMGINVIGTSIASSDLSLFCDAAHHPNAKGRYFFTSDLKEKLKIH